MVLVIRILLLGFIILGLLFAILATSTNYWLKLSTASFKIDGGLWKMCREEKFLDTSVKVCYSISEIEKLNPGLEFSGIRLLFVYHFK